MLSLGQGKYLKLHNDKACFHENQLTQLIKCLDKVDNSVVFILNDNRNLQKKGIIKCHSFDEFVQLVSFWSTWMCGMILKASEYKNLVNKDRAVGSNLIQTDIMFRLIRDGGPSLIINEKLQYEQELESKGGYNIFEVFISNYLGLYQEYLKTGIMSYKTYHKEKINLLINFIFPWYTRRILIKDKRYQFDASKANHIIIKHYWNEPHSLLYPIWLLRNGLKNYRRNRLRHDHEHMTDSHV